MPISARTVLTWSLIEAGPAGGTATTEQGTERVRAASAERAVPDVASAFDAAGDTGSVDRGGSGESGGAVAQGGDALAVRLPVAASDQGDVAALSAPAGIAAVGVPVARAWSASMTR
jgi:hypothetical protein